MAYCTVPDVKEYLGIDTSTDDALLDGLQTQAQAMIDEYCRQTFEASSDSTRNFDAVEDVDGATLYLDYPLASITSVTNGDSTTVTSTQYVTEPRNNTPYRALTLKSNVGNLWTFSTSPEDAIAIVGRWAYSTTAPADVKHACIVLTAFLYRRKDGVGGDAERPIITGDGVSILPARTPGLVVDILNRRRRSWFGISG